MKYNYIIILLLGFFLSTNFQAFAATPAQTTEAAVTGSAGQDSAKYTESGANRQMESFRSKEKSGIVMTITVMGIVFLGLIVLYLLFILIGSAAVSLSIKRTMKAFGITREEAKGITTQSGEVYAAIAMAIYEATELHDEENAILTIKNTVRNYSPWSSKIYTLRETPRR